MQHVHIFNNNDPNDNCTLLGYYAGNSCNSLPSFRRTYRSLFKGQVLDPWIWDYFATEAWY